MHVKHLYIIYTASLCAKGVRTKYDLSTPGACWVLIGSLGAREDCAEGLLKRIAQKDCLVGLGGCVMGLNWFSQVEVSYAAYAGLRLGSRLWVLGNLATWLGS